LCWLFSTRQAIDSSAHPQTRKTSGQNNRLGHLKNLVTLLYKLRHCISLEIFCLFPLTLVSVAAVHLVMAFYNFKSASEFNGSHHFINDFATESQLSRKHYNTNANEYDSHLHLGFMHI